MKLLFLALGTILILSINFTISKTENDNLKKDKIELEIRFQPDSILYVYENVGPEMSKQLYSSVIQNMAFINSSSETIVIKEASIKVINDGLITQTQNITNSKMNSSAEKFHMYQEHGILGLYDFQFQTSKYLNGIKFAANDTLQSGEAVIITQETLLFDKLPDFLEIFVNGTTLNGKEVTASKKIKIVNHKSKNSYILPLKGTWIAAAGPSLIGHHRWGTIQEFAFDFIKVGDGLLTYKNEGKSLSDFYAYNEPIYAISDGVVVSILNKVEESVDNIKKLNESEIEYLNRVKLYQEQLMSKGLEYVFGNHIIIRHPNNEYSTYFHLKHNSITVKEGDVIKQGQVIAKLGNSGNSTEPHLHFHISNGSDIAYSRSIPVEFDNIVLFPVDNGKIRHLHSGQILKTVD